MPTAAVEATVKVNAELPAPVMEVGLNAAVTPVGKPVAVRVTAELKPPVTAVATVLVPLPPGATETVVGEAEIVNPGAPVTVNVTVAVWLVVPLVPVTVIE